MIIRRLERGRGGGIWRDHVVYRGNIEESVVANSLKTEGPGMIENCLPMTGGGGVGGWVIRILQMGGGVGGVINITDPWGGGE